MLKALKIKGLTIKASDIISLEMRDGTASIRYKIYDGDMDFSISYCFLECRTECIEFIVE